MGKLPTITRLMAEDLPADQRKWFEKILMSLNSFISTILALLNKGLTFEDNMNAMVHTIDFIGRDFSRETGDPLIFSSTLNGSPKGVMVAKIEDISTTGIGPITSAVCVHWYYDSSGKVNITSIPGISTDGSKKYRVTLLVF